MNISLSRQLFAEAIGTFMLVFAGCGAIIINSEFGGAITHVGIAAVFGLVVMTGIYAVGGTSGAHFNPAVTLAFWLSGRMAFRTVIPYITTQAVAALAASLLLLSMFPEAKTQGQTNPAGSSWQSFVLEVVMTWWLVTVILSVSSGDKAKGMFAGIAVGGTVALEAMFGGPVSGASMNPVRSFGPAITSGDLVNLWIYLTAPVLGGILAVLSCRASVCDEDCC